MPHTGSQPSPSSRTRARGFTLAEVAMVLAITGVLAAVAVTRYAKFIEKARVARAISEIQAISRGLDAMQIDGGKLPDTLADADLKIERDPWGNPYQYLKIQGTLPAGQAANDPSGLPPVAASGDAAPKPRMDRFLVPINTDYDLYSRGADGQSERQLDRKVSRDDVIRAANGSYFGLAENF